MNHQKFKIFSWKVYVYTKKDFILNGISEQFLNIFIHRKKCFSKKSNIETNGKEKSAVKLHTNHVTWLLNQMHNLFKYKLKCKHQDFVLEFLWIVGLKTFNYSPIYCPHSIQLIINFICYLRCSPCYSPLFFGQL